MQAGPRLKKVWVDFGEVSDDSFLTAICSPKRQIVTGEVVLMRDGDGNSCMGIVEMVKDDMLWIKPSWDTWLAADAELLTAPSGSVTSVFDVHQERQGSVSGNLLPQKQPVLAIAYA